MNLSVLKNGSDCIIFGIQKQKVSTFVEKEIWKRSPNVPKQIKVKINVCKGNSFFSYLIDTFWLFISLACEEPQPPPFPALPFTHLPTTPFPIPIFATNIEDGKPLDLSAATPTRERSPSSIDGENVSPSGGKSIQLKVPQILKSGCVSTKV